MITNHPAKLTPAQFYALPQDNAGYELVRGKLVREPPPGVQHGMVAAHICAFLTNYVRTGGRSGVVLTCDTWFELTQLPATVRAPDVAFITMERFRTLADVRKAAPGAPDLAVEVQSPSQSAASMRSKVDDYLLAGTQVVWVVNPDRAHVVVYGQGLRPRTLTGRDAVTAPGLLPGFSVTVASILDLPTP